MIRVYETSHSISRTICRAFAPGCNGQVVPAVELLEGDVACYGLLRGTHEVLTEAKNHNRDWWYIDLGYQNRSDHYHGKFDGYYRVSKNSYQSKCLGDYPDDRWQDLDIQLQPWKRNGEHILICPMSYNLAVHLDLDPRQWLKDTISEISKYTDRSIMVKPKSSDMTLGEALLDCHAIVGYETNALVDAVIAGTPAFNLGYSAIHPIALQDLSRIESPIYPDRRPWTWALAYNQWTLDEFKDGTCWRMLKENENNDKEYRQRKRIRYE